MKFISVTVLLSFTVINAASAQSLVAGSTWVNDSGSEMAITAIGGDGALTGTYTNNASGFDCKNEPMVLSGWVDGNLVSFSVRWKNATKNCASITTWTGYFAAGKIFTDWDLVYTAAGTGLPTHLKQSNVFSPK